MRGALAAAVLCLPVVVLASLVTISWDELIEVDQRAILAATGVTRSHPALFDALITWQEIFLPWHVYLAALPIAIWTWVRGLRGRTIWGVATMLIGWNLGLQAKLIVERARPLYDDPVSRAPGFSFPSGHAFNTAMMLVTSLIMAWPLLRRWPSPARVAVVAAAAVVIVLTALDRVFLGVHFPSDVVAGVLLALGLAFASYLGYRYEPRRESR